MKIRSTSNDIPRTKIRNGLLLVGVIALVALGYSFPHIYNKLSDKVHEKIGPSIGHIREVPFRLGLDLRGGAQLMYEVNATSVAPTEQASAVEGARDVIERRVNAFGVGEPLVQTTKTGGNWRVLVELPDVHDVQKAIDMIGATPTLEFRDKIGSGDLKLEEAQKKELTNFNKASKVAVDAASAQLKKGVKFEEVYAANKGADLGFVTQQSNAAVFAWAASHRVGDISRDPIDAKDGYYLVQRGDQKQDPENNARHILICWKDIEGCTTQLSKEEALQKVNELLRKATPQNFSDLAKVNSMEPGAATSGGDLGWFAKGVMVKPFDEKIFAMKKGEIFGPLETQFGYHLVYKVDERLITSYSVKGMKFQKKSAEDLFANSGDWKPTGLSGKQLERATVDFDQNTGEPIVNLAFNAEGKELFAEITKRNIGSEVAIFLDGQPISIPVVRQPILDGRAVISGNFKLEQAKQLVERLNAGALPLPIKLMSQQTVGATLGAKSLHDSAVAGLIGFVLVLIFLTAFYRVPGFFASCALLIYAVIVLAVFKFIPVTLTLAGIAGFILSMGMAVDANVLVFERTREELATGKSPMAALEEAFPRAWNSIRDSNMSSLITCAILYWFGSSIVRGFALTLAIGIAASLFSAITVTRLMLRAIAPYLKDKPGLFVPAKQTKE